MTSAEGHRHVRIRRLVAAVAIASATLVVPTAAAHAISSPPLIVPCSGPNGGAPGLIAAIHKANRRGHPTTIELAAHCVYTLVKIDNNNSQGSNGLPVIIGTIEIRGNGATIFRAKKSAPYRILEVGGPPAALALDHVTIANGALASPGGGILNDGGTVTLTTSRVVSNKSGLAEGGGIDNLDGGTVVVSSNSEIFKNVSGGYGGSTCPTGGAGIFNDTGGTVTVDASVVSSNLAQCHIPIGATVSGGGIDNEPGATLKVINHSKVNLNHVLAGSSGDVALGGGIESRGTLTVADSQVDANSVGSPVHSAGGGIDVSGPWNVSNSDVSGNAADNDGGGISTSSSSGNVSTTTISNNNSSGDPFSGTGGGAGVSNTGTLTVTGSQVTQNGATGVPNQGGGFYNNGNLTIDSTQVTANTAASGGGIYNDTSGTVTLQNGTTVTGNTPDNCHPTIPGCTG